MDKLYKRDSKGVIREWSVCVSGDETVVTHGVLTGKLQEKRTKCKPKNVGRKNETTSEQQAELEAKALWTKQKERQCYVEDLGYPPAYLQPMLARDATKVGHQIDWDKKDYVGQPKIDGCFTRASTVWTDQGLLAIGHIVDKKLQVNVASFNNRYQQVEFKPVVGWFNNGKKHITEWMGFSSKRKITRQHKVYTPEGWEDAEAAAGKQALLVDKNIGAAITGFLLGDGCASVEKRYKHKQRRVQWRLLWSACQADKNYGDLKSQLLSSIVKVKSMPFTSGYGHPQNSYTTSLCSALPYDLSRFYDLDIESDSYGKRKQFLSFNDLAVDFNDLSLAIWYFDDGSITFNNGNRLTPRIHFSIPRYSEKTVTSIKDLFRIKYGITPTIKKYGKDRKMSFTSAASVYLLWRMAAVAGGLMPRKMLIGSSATIPTLSKNPSWDKSLVGNVCCPGKPSTKEVCAYDIEVADNHNYFVEGMLVHNCRAINTGAKLQSRKGTFYTAPKHILEAISDLGLQDLNLDGELFRMGLPLNQILSAARKENENTANLQYYVFDLAIQERNFADRYNTLVGCIPQDHPVIKIVPIEWLHADKVKSTHDKYVQEGFEGLMIRDAYSLYGFGERPNTLFKFKKFKEEEFMVVGVDPDKHDKQGILVCVTQDTQRFGVRMRGTDAQRERYLSHPKEVIGKQCTVRFFEYTEYGIPQFPVGVLLT